MTSLLIMDARDRERLWEALLPTLQAMKGAYIAMPLATISGSGTYRDPEKRYPAALGECRKRLDELEALYAQAQAVHDNFKPAYPEVPLVSAGDTP